MIELLLNYRTLLYRRVYQPGKAENEVKWELLSRIVDYPTELAL